MWLKLTTFGLLSLSGSHNKYETGALPTESASQAFGTKISLTKHIIFGFHAALESGDVPRTHESGISADVILDVDTAVAVEYAKEVLRE
jgi:hypothetical protein